MRWCFFFPTGSGDARERNAPAYTSAYGGATLGICALHSGPCPVRFSSPQSIVQWFNPTTPLSLPLCFSALTMGKIRLVIAPLDPGHKGEALLNRIRLE